jgi:hypothetical protein
MAVALRSKNSCIDFCASTNTTLKTLALQVTSALLLVEYFLPADEVNQLGFQQ